MNWGIAAVILYLALAVELGLRGGLALAGVASPSMVFATVALIAAFAPLMPALTYALIAGVLVDLCTPVGSAGGAGIVVVGPSGVGFLVGAYCIYAARGLFLRRNPLALVVLAILGAAVAGTIGAVLLLVRGAVDREVLLPGSLILPRLGSALYTGLPALALGLVWKRTLPWLGVPDPYTRR